MWPRRVILQHCDINSSNNFCNTLASSSIFQYSLHFTHIFAIYAHSLTCHHLPLETNRNPRNTGRIRNEILCALYSTADRKYRRHYPLPAQRPAQHPSRCWERRGVCNACPKWLSRVRRAFHVASVWSAPCKARALPSSIAVAAYLHYFWAAARHFHSPFASSPWLCCVVAFAPFAAGSDRSRVAWRAPLGSRARSHRGIAIASWKAVRALKTERNKEEFEYQDFQQIIYLYLYVCLEYDLSTHILSVKFTMCTSNDLWFNYTHFP